ncbi:MULTISPECIES: hypothetical protein [Streptomyces]|uniref:Uncharacterized protein n=1 Tax=Streptomyces tsukubensis (strain DSM 42081 / NBRC 108919 / NRRL 18488 / 9993) TaxID=1114943 RepID=I2N375_STRT9|nr:MULTISPECIES: hypothetical protein [Streptomyces]AZK95606.1 hypothetical protein B7R87_18395 [Streptomyces tsukubensis]EIF91472.1 hypothetical protein [Streptomyces tsukubensis NRRL18488]MYS68441.1 hypothetical protein [Streptomyces sp. SID5473]QKM68359.1 hypothetical protein STSU_015400 [Streptomyces tsukubensis NRRL18488]TAI43176.1 hypothetical protein EWI31_15165 [Streptomyces tsukubensis]
MGFMRYKATAFSWVLATPSGSEWRLLFGRGMEGALINEQQRIGSDYLTALAPQLVNFQGRGLALGAVLLSRQGENRQSLFFSGNTYYWYDWEQKATLSQGPWTTLANWGTALPAGYRSQVDVLFQAPDGAGGSRQTYFFKGGRVLTLNWSTGVVREALITDGPDASGCEGWARLPEDFRSGLDHVAAYKPAADGTRQSLLIKGVKGVLLNWKTGVLASGAFDRLGVPGLAALADHHRESIRPVTGRWTGTLGNQRVEIRVDLEGERTLGVISGDLFTGDTWTDSFRTAADLSVVPGHSDFVVSASGLTWANNSPWTDLVVQLPHVVVNSPARTAHVALFVPASSAMLQLTCSYAGPALRSVEMETDAMAGTQVFQSYDTSRGSWAPRGYRHRVLTVASAFAEAGIELKNAGQVNVVAPDASGADLKWSAAELHAAMEANFSLHRDSEQWKIWTFVATYHTLDPRVLGVMFDQMGRERQGMAVFHSGLQYGNYIGDAMELFCYVHELGHVFNLHHSWEKHLSAPPAPLGPNNGFGDLSWMNYPEAYNTGTRAGVQHFWEDFPYSFSENELRHLRHGFHRHIVPGGDAFLANTALDLSATPQAFALPGAGEDPGLTLTLGGKQFFGYGEPVMAELRLSRTGVRGDVSVAEAIGPAGERTKIVITDPYGRTRVFRPIARTCSGHGDAEPTVTLTEANPALYETAYLGYGSDGLYFSEPGTYRVTAVHTGLDGARTVSPTRTIRVRTPLDRADQEVGELLTGDDQGTLLAFLGSDAPHLTAGNDALQELIARHGDHPLAAYARLARGANAGRHFQTIGDGRLQVRGPDTKTAVSQLTEAITVSRTDQDTGLDNLTLNAAFRRLATVHAKAGDLERAEATLDTLVTHFQEQGVPAAVQRHIQEQAETARAGIRETAGEEQDS